MEILTLIIAIAGFLMSLISWVRDIVTQRVHLDVQITRANVNVKNPGLFCYLSVVNRSRLPIAITSLAISQSGIETYCIPVPKCVLEHTHKIGNTVVERRTEYSTALPIQLQGLGGLTVLAQFEGLPEAIQTDSKSLNLVVYTNRGKPRKMTLPLPEELSDLRTMSLF